MRSDQSETVTQLAHEAVQSLREVDAQRAAQGLIQSYIGADSKVISMPHFQSALVQALKEARLKGQDDCDVLTLI
jgi:hypothetical protein